MLLFAVYWGITKTKFLRCRLAQVDSISISILWFDLLTPRRPGIMVHAARIFLDLNFFYFFVGITSSTNIIHSSNQHSLELPGKVMPIADLFPSNIPPNLVKVQGNICAHSTNPMHKCDCIYQMVVIVRAVACTGLSLHVWNSMCLPITHNNNQYR